MVVVVALSPSSSDSSGPPRLLLGEAGIGGKQRGDATLTGCIAGVGGGGGAGIDNS